MSRSLNRAMLIGNLGARPEVRTSRSGRRVATFRVATHEGRDGARTLWHRIVAWDELGEDAGRRLRTGQRVYVEGRVENRSWEDGRGRARSVTEIIAHEIVYLEETGAPLPLPWKEPGTDPGAGPAQDVPERRTAP